MLFILDMFLLAKGLLFLTCALSTGFAINCFRKCSKVWSKGAEIEKSEFHNFIINNKTQYTYKLLWKWPDEENSGSWEVFYNEQSHKASKTGGFSYRMPNRQKNSFVNWRLTNNSLLSWTSEYKKVPFESWNLTLCESGLKLSLEPSKNGWTYHLGNIRIPGGESGKLFVDENFLPNTFHAKVKVSRKKRDDKEVEKLEDATVWNRIKGYFKELLDNGPNDQRGWLTRITDWLLGFLERILS